MLTDADKEFLYLTAVVTVGYQFFFFIIAVVLKFDKVIDFAGSSNFTVIALLTLIQKGTWHLRQVVLTSMMVIWSSRLAIYLLIRILRWGEDRRHDKMRNSVANIAVYFIVQGFWAWAVTLPITVVNASDKDPNIQAADIIGWIMWFVGASVELLADIYKFSFKNSPESKGKWCDLGPWKYSRHPNYFGDILLASGYFVASIPILEGSEWYVVLIGPIFVTLLLLFVSGLPALEASADKKFGNVDAYRIYKKRTSPLIPLPHAVYGNLPHWFKAVFLFEFPIYSRYLHKNRRSNSQEGSRDEQKLG
ncbi:FKBP-type peptidyl-prolyl cis-trans isomerase 5 isoform 2 [Hibiscus syriacus]|uniref:FKBP-type peptidyl-prolyl cis-trans isomerase 5 isoform 2 n=1 Tax=Hibiscus syriacus TaxID=106335 RepID=A0A6A2ZSD7_HIBSY|nr:uncharacterized protein LOC120140538 [Hibiscus syriacus]KAE8694209.1 FKBP-type peptidyl-prolyl cis-trans isomerase 5 isoform 2 [Hibiscus syriacus]